LSTIWQTCKCAIGVALISCNIAAAAAKLRFDMTPYNPLGNLVDELEVTSKASDKVSVKSVYSRESGMAKITNLDDTNSDPQNSSALIDYFVMQQPRLYTVPGDFCLKLTELTLPLSDSLIESIKQRTGKTEKAIFLRAIPAHVLNRYPGMFSNDEIFNDNNLRALPISLATVDGLSKYRAPWIDLFKENRIPRKQEVLDVLVRIDKTFQNLYVAR
jgi:hypothetical protein